MKISPPRREMYKQSIRNLLLTNPKLTNIELAQRIGLHRNTVSRLLEEIRLQNEKLIKETWSKLLNELLERAKMRLMQLEELWIDSYSTCTYKGRPTQMVEIVKAYWKISKDMYQKQLEFLGIREDPKTLIQVNMTS